MENLLTSPSEKRRIPSQRRRREQVSMSLSASSGEAERVGRTARFLLEARVYLEDQTCK